MEQTSYERCVYESVDDKSAVPHYKYGFLFYNTNITLILYSAIIAFSIVMLLHLTISRKSRNNLELAAKNSVLS